MAKKIVKKRKLKVFRLLLILIVAFGLFFGVYVYLRQPVVNLIVEGNEYLEDDYILEVSGLIDYPSFWLTSVSRSEKKLEKVTYIKTADIDRKFYHKVIIKITENKALFSKVSDNDKIVFEDGKEVKPAGMSFRIPRLLNYVPDDKYEEFIDGMSGIDDKILMKISDIEYVPNDLDKDRFLLYMDDGNMVYLTLTKFDMINYYNDVLSQLEDRKGILYLDNGNHFQIKE